MIDASALIELAEDSAYYSRDLAKRGGDPARDNAGEAHAAIMQQQRAERT